MGTEGQKWECGAPNQEGLSTGAPEELDSKSKNQLQIEQLFKTKPSFPSADSQTKLRRPILTLIVFQKKSKSFLEEDNITLYKTVTV